MLEEGARTGRVTIGTMPDGTPRTVSFDLNQSNEQSETPLHATILAAAEALALVAAPSDDPWVRAAAREDARLLATPVASPLANASAPTAAIDAEAEARLVCVKLLLEAGAERERKVYGRSALHLVCACAALPSLTAFASKAAALLLEGGASISQVDACGSSCTMRWGLTCPSLPSWAAHRPARPAACMTRRVPPRCTTHFGRARRVP